ncbi:MAG: glycosyltransferase family 4 protein [Nitrosomonas ureae]
MENIKKIKVLHLISSKAFLGAERVICEIVRKSGSKNTLMAVGILTASEGLDRRFINEIHRKDIDIVRFGEGSKLSYTCIKEINQYINRNSINIVHSHNYKSDFYAFLVKIIFREKFRLVASNHTWKLNTFREYGYKWLDSIIMKKFSALVAISSEIKEEMIKIGVNASKIKVITNGVDCIEFEKAPAKKDARKKLEVNESDFIIGSVASLTPEKGHRDLLKAFSTIHLSVPQAKLVFIGEGPEREELQNCVLTNGLAKKVLIMGSRDDVRDLYKGFDIFFLASYQEGLPMALLEAMASGVPVIATAVGAIPEVIQNKNNGIIVRPGNIEEMLQAIKIMFLEEELRNLMGEKGMMTVRQRYSSERMLKEYEKLYEQVFLFGLIK